MLRIQLPGSVKTRKSKIIYQRKGWNRPHIFLVSAFMSRKLNFGGLTFERKLKRQISFCFIGTLKDEFKRLFNRKIMKVFRHNSVWFHPLCRTAALSVETWVKTILSYVSKLTLAESDPYYEKLQSAKRKLETFIDAHQGSR